MTDLFATTNHTCAPLPVDPSTWNEQELAEALQAGHPQAETELSVRHFMRVLNIRDRKQIEPAHRGGVTKSHRTKREAGA